MLKSGVREICMLRSARGRTPASALLDQLVVRTEAQKAEVSSMENLESVPCGTVEKFCIEMARYFESNPAFQLKIPG